MRDDSGAAAEDGVCRVVCAELVVDVDADVAGGQAEHNAAPGAAGHEQEGRAGEDTTLLCAAVSPLQ